MNALPLLRAATDFSAAYTGANEEGLVIKPKVRLTGGSGTKSVNGPQHPASNIMRTIETRIELNVSTERTQQLNINERSLLDCKCYYGLGTKPNQK